MWSSTWSFSLIVNICISKGTRVHNSNKSEFQCIWLINCILLHSSVLQDYYKKVTTLFLFCADFTRSHASICPPESHSSFLWQPSLSNIALINVTVKEIYSLTLHQWLLHLVHNLNVTDSAVALLADLNIIAIFLHLTVFARMHAVCMSHCNFPLHAIILTPNLFVSDSSCTSAW